MNRFKTYFEEMAHRVALQKKAAAESESKCTPRVRQALVLAESEARRLHHNFIGTEHLLLGLTGIGEGAAVRVLQRMGADLEKTRAELEKWVGHGLESPNTLPLAFTPRTKKVFALAEREAIGLGHTYVGTESLLLGLLGEGDGVAARVLKHLGVEASRVRQEILRELGKED